MNLEQIKDTQENLNRQLTKVGEELKTTVNFIAGEELSVLENSNSEEVSNTAGILEKIALSQQESSVIIGSLYNQVVKLVNSTWQNEQDTINCTKVQ